MVRRGKEMRLWNQKKELGVGAEDPPKPSGESEYVLLMDGQL